MASKNKTQVLIGGRIYTVSGYESEEYLQRVAAFLNNKITQIKTIDGYSSMSPELKGLLLNLNTADEYFKLKKQADDLASQVTARDKELYEIKHELITTQMQLEAAQKSLQAQEEERQSVSRQLMQFQLESQTDARLGDGQEAPAGTQDSVPAQQEAGQNVSQEPETAQDVTKPSQAQGNVPPERQSR